jgi:hypothetical protein
MVSTVGTRVEFRSLDRLLEADADGKRVLIKIDVEGTESAIFQQGWRAIARCRPRIVCEILRSAVQAPTLGAELRRRGYRLFNITDSGLFEHDTPHSQPEVLTR